MSRDHEDPLERIATALESIAETMAWRRAVAVNDRLNAVEHAEAAAAERVNLWEPDPDAP